VGRCVIKGRLFKQVGSPAVAVAAVLVVGLVFVGVLARRAAGDVTGGEEAGPSEKLVTEWELRVKELLIRAHNI